MHQVLAYIGLGSNLDHPQQQLERALTELEGLPHCQLLAHSPLYCSAPLGPADQPDYVNAVAALLTGCSAEALLDQLQAIEQAHQRVREQHWGPRTLDLDILLFGEAQITSPRLQIPHPEMAKRAFVLYPLADIAPELEVPGLGALSQLMAACPPQGLEPLDA